MFNNTVGISGSVYIYIASEGEACRMLKLFELRFRMFRGPFRVTMEFQNRTLMFGTASFSYFITIINGIIARPNFRPALTGADACAVNLGPCHRAGANRAVGWGRGGQGANQGRLLSRSFACPVRAVVRRSGPGRG